jgi:hypothetical protein
VNGGKSTIQLLIIIWHCFEASITLHIFVLILLVNDFCLKRFLPNGYGQKY